MVAALHRAAELGAANRWILSRLNAVVAEVDAFYDDSGSIGRRYARADDVGVPFCVTVDYDSLKDGTVTVRSRDGREQQRVKADELPARGGEMTRFPPVFG